MQAIISKARNMYPYANLNRNELEKMLLFQKNCFIDTGTELDFKKAGFFYVGIVCVRESFNSKLICRRVRFIAHRFAKSSLLNETFEVTEDTIFVK